MPPINLLIKPSSSRCNLSCKYCFYYDVSSHREIEQYDMMSIDTLDTVVKKAMEYAERSCNFAFQGGEPTLSGLEFFEKFIEIQKKYKKDNIVINNAIQTNGMLIDENFAKFFAKNNFLVGLSLDGNMKVHDTFRLDKGENKTFKKVMDTASLFNKFDVEYNILTVITKQLAQNIQNVYKFYIKNNFRYMQFIPCLDDMGEKKGQNFYSLTPKVYERFLKDLFDMWYDDITSGNFVYIRYFENIIQILLGYYPEACGMAGECTYQNIVEADGSVYPCDFYVTDKYKLGNLCLDSFGDINKKRNDIKFIDNSKNKDLGCIKCKWHRICYGGCRRDRDLFDNGKMGRNYFCSAYEGFFAYSFDRLIEIAENIRKTL